jgi:hypothetical protein
VHLTDETHLAYVNVPRDGQRPRPGYQASVWLAQGEPDTASAVTFSSARPPTPRPDYVGRVLAVSPDCRQVTLQLPPKKKGEPPAQAVVRISDKTRVTYAQVAFDGEKPTVGYQATVWLAKGTTDTAGIVTFSDKKANLPKPDFVGTVARIGPDGKELTLNVPPRQKGEAPRTATVRIGDRTKLVYLGMEKGRQKPVVGLAASVWLEKGSTDTALGIRFSEPPAKKKSPQPAKPDGRIQAFFTLPGKIALTADQQKHVEALVKELTPRYQQLLAKRDALLTGEQKAAQAIALKAVKEAGLTEPVEVRQALDAAIGLTPEQAKRRQELQKQERDLKQEYLTRARAFVGDEQKTRLAGPQP